MKIEKIIYEKNKDTNLYTKAIVYYEDGSSETVDDVIGAMKEFMDQEGLNFNSLMKDKRIIEGTPVRERADITPHHDERSTPVPASSTSGNIGEDEEKKGKGKGLGIKILSIASALVLAGVAAHYHLNKSKSKSFSNNTGAATITTTVKPTNPPTITPKPAVSVSKTDTTPDENYNEVFRDNVGQTIEHMDPLTRNIIALYRGERLSESDLFDTINGINRLCQANMAEVEKLIEGGRMSGDMILPLFDEMFPEGSLENKVLSNFVSRRNVLVENAYHQDAAYTASEVNDYNDFFLDFIEGSVTFEYQGKRYGYNDLSPIARYIIFMLGQTTLETNHNYSANINGRDYSFMDLINLLEDRFNIVATQLFDKGKTK